MRQRGTIRSWKDDKGFGFVTPLAGGEDAFVHINAFLNRQRRPVDGDEISYEAVQDFQKRWQAKAIRYADEPEPVVVAAEPVAVAPARRSPSDRSALPLLRWMLALLILAILGLAAYLVWSGASKSGSQAQSLPEESAPAAPLVDSRPVGTPVAAEQPVTAPVAKSIAPAPAAATPSGAGMDEEADSEASPYRCDGRTRCPQMHSCEEANWFVAHCPNTEMDGDGDGIACERQWCNRG